MSLVREIIEGIGKDPLGELLIEIDEMLISYEIRDHHGAIQLLFNSLDEIDTGDVFMMLSKFLKSQMFEFLTDFKLTVDHDFEDLVLIKEVYRFMSEIDGLDNLEQYMAIIDEGTSTDDILFDMISLHSGRASIEYGQLITYIMPSLITDIREMITEKIEADAIEADALKHQAPRMFILDKTPKRFGKLIEEGFALGFSLKVYIDEMFKDEEIVKSNSIIDELAIDLTSAVLASKEGSKEGINLLEVLVEPYFPTDLIFTEQVIRQVKELITPYRKHEDEQV